MENIKVNNGGLAQPDSSSPNKTTDSVSNETLRNALDHTSEQAPVEVAPLSQYNSDTESSTSRERPQQQTGNLKRTRDVSHIDDPEDTKRPKKPETKDLDKEVTSSLTKMAIISETYPRELITEEHYIKIRESLFSLFENARPYPDLVIDKVSGGIVHLTCRNKCSIKWLQKKLNGTKIEELILKVIEKKYLPQPVKVIWSSINTGHIELDRLLQLMQKMNPGLNTNLWRIVDTLVRGLQVKRKVFMDPPSVEYIRKKEFRVNAGLEDNYFTVYDDKKTRRD